MALLNLVDVQNWVTGLCPPLGATDLALHDALGCVLAEDVVSSEAVPPFANTAMDGFAVRAADVAAVPCDLVVVGTLAAGGLPDIAVGPGQALRIMTGAAMPDGADSIVPVENVDPAATNDTVVRVLQTARLGDAVRPAGEDVQVGQLVFASGTVLEAGHLGVLASIGRRTVLAHRRVRVGILSTGDELIEAPAPLLIGQIRDSNRYSLAALVRAANAEPIDLGLARDNESDIEARMLDGLTRCDAVVTSGGVSVGDFDFVKGVLDRLSRASGDSGGHPAGDSSSGAAGDSGSHPMRWMQIAIRPAKPLAFGLIGGKPVFGLPGNPVSCMVSFELFARAGLRRMMGFADGELHRRPIRAIADEALGRRADGKIVFSRVMATMEGDGRLHVRSSGGQGSNLLRSMALANALAVLPDGDGFAAGDELDVLLLGGLGGMS